MSIMKRIAGAAAAAALAISAAFVGAGVANADGVLDVKADKAVYMPGDTATVTVTGCDAPDILNVMVSNDKGQTKNFMNVKSPVKVELPGVLGKYTVNAKCVSYDDDSVVAQGTTTFDVKYDGVIFDKSTWKAGDTLTLTAFGFKPGEKVTLIMTDKSSGKVVWTTAFGTADEEGIVEAKVVLKSDVPLGTYTLTLKGDESGRMAMSQFYWGTPDKENGKDKGDKGSTKPGVPKTGN